MLGPRQAYAYEPTKEILDVEGRSLQNCSEYGLSKALVGHGRNRRSWAKRVYAGKGTVTCNHLIPDVRR
jgi:hypothetical protein